MTRKEKDCGIKTYMIYYKQNLRLYNCKFYTATWHRPVSDSITTLPTLVNEAKHC